MYSSLDKKLLGLGIRALFPVETEIKRCSEAACVIVLPSIDSIPDLHPEDYTTSTALNSVHVTFSVAGRRMIKKVGLAVITLQNQGWRDIRICPRNQEDPVFYDIHFSHGGVWRWGLEKVIERSIRPIAHKHPDKYTVCLDSVGFAHLFKKAVIEKPSVQDHVRVDNVSIAGSATLLENAHEKIKLLEAMNARLVRDSANMMREYRRHSAVADAPGIDKKKTLTLYFQGEYLDD